jgi:hypothetical protein
MWPERRPSGTGEGNEGWFPRRRHSQSSRDPPVPAEVDDTGLLAGQYWALQANAALMSVHSAWARKSTAGGVSIVK